jgi:microcystin degradation protein MlrC
VRAAIGDAVPLVASLDLHANVTRRMLELADALTSYRTYPHIDMADTGARAADLLARRITLGRRQALRVMRLPFLISLNAQSTWISPAQQIYEQLTQLDAQHGASLNFCMGFPASDFDECAPVVWGYADAKAAADAATDALFAAASEPAQWRLPILPAAQAAARAIDAAAHARQPVVIADTEDNPGAGGDSNTTGLLRALLDAKAGQRYPQQVAIGMLFDPDTAKAACEAGVGAVLERAIGKSVPYYGGMSDAPVQGRFVVRAVSDGRCTLQGPMMTGAPLSLGPSACLEIDGILVAVVSGKAQLLDRVMLSMVGVDALKMKIIGVKSSNHFRADFTPIAAEVLVAKANGPMAASPADLPWKKLSRDTRVTP